MPKQPHEPEHAPHLTCHITTALPEWPSRTRYRYRPDPNDEFNQHVKNINLLHLITTDFIGTGATDPYVGLATPREEQTTRKDWTFQFHRNQFTIISKDSTLWLGKIKSIIDPSSTTVDIHLYGSIDTGPWYQRSWLPQYTLQDSILLGHQEIPGSRPRIVTISEADATFVFDNLIANKLPSTALRFINAQHQRKQQSGQQEGATGL